MARLSTSNIRLYLCQTQNRHKLNTKAVIGVDDRAYILTGVTVHRVGPMVPREVSLHRTELGRVLITIDDLAALMTHLAGYASGDLQVEFDGGYFTEPEELRTLSDMEMRSLRLKTPNVQVVLSPTEAFAIGDHEAAEEVYRVWARPRQTKRTPSIRLNSAMQNLSWTVLGFSVGVFAPVVLVIITALKRAPSPGITGLVIGVLALIVLVTALILAGAFNRVRKSSYAIIEPLTLSEYRLRLSTERYPRRSWIVAVAAIVATATVTIGIFILTKVLGP